MPFTSINIEEDLIVAAGQTITFSPSNEADTTAFWLVNAPYNAWAYGSGDPNFLLPDLPTLINYGNLIATDTATPSWGVNVLFVDESAFWAGITVENHGLMSAFSQHSEAFAFRAPGWSPSIVNTGRMIAEAPEFYAVAILSYGANMPTPYSGPWSIQNSASGELIAIGDIADAVKMPFANFFNDGLVSAQGGSVEGVGVWANGGHIENNGQILAEASDGGRAVGIALGLIDAFNGPRDTTIVNSGLIQAATAIDEQYNGGVATTIVNSGDIRGDIVLYDGDDIIRNSGSLTGNVQLGDGADLYDGRGGVLHGVLNAGAGDDTLMLDGGGGAFDGGEGTDLAQIDFSTATAPIIYVHSDAQADLTVGGDVVLTLSGVERIDITCGAGYDQITGGALDDVIRLGLGGGVVDGGGGFDFVSLDFSDQTAAVVYTHDNTEAQVLVGGEVAAVVRNAEAVEIIGGAGQDHLVGGSGDDILVGGPGGDVLDGGAGSDTASYANSAAGVTIALGGAVSGGDATGDTLLNMESLIGSAYADALTGDANANTLDGGAGADVLQGGAGDDTYIIDNVGDVVVEAANAGYDLVRSSVSLALGANVEALTLTGAASINATGNGSNNVLVGNAGDNLIVGGAGADSMDGGDGFDTASYALSQAAVNVSLATGFGHGGDAEGDFLINFEGLVGSQFSDVLVGNYLNNHIEGGAGADQIDGADGVDTVIYSNSAAGVSVNLLTGICTGGEAEGDFLVHIEGVQGSAFDDVLVGGDSGVNLLNGGAGDDTLVGGYAPGQFDGGDGFDTLSYAFMVSAITVDLTKSQVSQFPYISDTLQNIEKIVGTTYNDLFIGDGHDNWFDGGAGADTMSGGAGDDTYYVDNAGDVVVEDAGEGTDTVYATIGVAALAAFVVIGLLRGSAGAGYGNELNNRITGDAANNTLNGLAGADTMIGGLGNDTYFVDNVGDVVMENAGEGTDTIRSAIGIAALAANVENLGLLNSVATGYGNSLNNVITGNGANNTLNGLAGADTMIGGLGNDTYFVDNAGDVVTELANQGTDTIYSTISLTLAQNVENLTLTGSALNATGNGLNNVLMGDAQKNVLNGGAGEDTMAGGLDSDTYVYNSAGDVIVENANEGVNDTVLAYIDVAALMANVENVTLAGAALNATGNELNNILTGNALNNTLVGGLGGDQLNGAVGADTLIGGQGDDAYLVDNSGDVVIENAGEGNDIVYAWVTIASLAANLERATLVGGGNLDITANDLDNRLWGNGDNNTLNGMGGADLIGGLDGDDLIIGGAGADQLYGGAGHDVFVYQTLSDSGTIGANRDTIMDFTQGSDLIDLSAIDANSSVAGDQAFSFLGTGAFTHTAGQARFDLIDNPGAANDYTLISLDQNGDGIADAQIALKGLYTLTAADFVL